MNRLLPRYQLRAEPRPHPLPTAWRALWEVRDTATSARDGAVMARFWAWGAADRYCRCLNDPTTTRCPVETYHESHVERMATAS